MTQFRDSLKTSIITSFNPRCSLALPSHCLSPDVLPSVWPSTFTGVDGADSPMGADIYLLMEEDVTAWRREFGNHSDSQPTSAFAFFADLDDRQLDRMANDLVQNARCVGTRIVALTSFFPEVDQTLSEDDEDADQCQRMLTRIFYLAARIGAMQATSAPVVQLVAGSIIEDVKLQSRGASGRTAAYVMRGNEDRLLANLLDRLSGALAEAGVWCSVEAGINRAFGSIKVALELEPGPLYLLRTGGSLKAFASRILQHDASVKRTVGFNLDITHWFLADRLNSDSIPVVDRISEGWLQEHNPEIADRIFHSHISGHSSRGHLGDKCLSRVSAEFRSTLKSWLCVLRRLPNVQYVSLELEAVHSMAIVETSGKLLLEWVDQLGPPGDGPHASLGERVNRKSSKN